MKRRRLLRILLVVLGLILFTGYFAFSTLLFSPLEGSYELRLTTLVTRNVDFYFSKVGLADDFEEFPRLAVADAMEASEGGTVFLASDTWQEWMAAFDLETRLAGVEEALAQAPVEVDLLDLFGGGEFTLAGRLDGVSSEGTEWVCLGRTSWMGKLAFELLPYLDLAASGLSFEEGENSSMLSGGQLTEPLYLLRMQDVLIAGNTAELVEAAPSLDQAAGEDSLFLSGEFTNYVRNADGRVEQDWEIGGDFRVAAETMKWSRAWPDVESESLFECVASHFFQLNLVEEFHGVMGFEGGPGVRLHGELNQGMLTEEQRRLYELREFDARALVDWATWAPADSVFFTYAHLDLADVLMRIRSGMEQADRDLLDDTVRQVWGYTDATDLVHLLDTCFEDKIGLVVTPDRYFDNTEGAPLTNGDPVFTWALMLRLEEESDEQRPDVNWKIDEVREKIASNTRAFGIQSPNGDGVFTNRSYGGTKIYEYHIPDMPGTGHLASVALSDGWFLLTNNHKFLSVMLANRYEGSGSTSLAQDATFTTLRQAAPQSGNLALWWNPRAGGELARDIARFGARYEAEAAIPWTVQRPRIESELLAENYDGRPKSQLSPQELSSFESELQPRLNAWRDEFVADYSTQFEADRQRALLMQELVSGSLTVLSLDRDEFTLYSRSRVPLDR